jgi:hypothetical protein
VIARELRSEVCSLHLRKGTGYRDPAVEAFLAEGPTLPQLPAPAQVWPPLGDAEDERRPRHGAGQVEGAPALPSGVGVALNLPAEAPAAGADPVWLRGSFRLPLRPRHLVRGHDVGDPAATAVAPVHLVVTAASHALVRQVTLHVPVRHALEADAPEGTGAFAVDLRTTPGVSTEATTHFVYAFAGGALSGPAPIAFTR